LAKPVASRFGCGLGAPFSFLPARRELWFPLSIVYLSPPRLCPPGAAQNLKTPLGNIVRLNMRRSLPLPRVSLASGLSLTLAIPLALSSLPSNRQLDISPRPPDGHNCISWSIFGSSSRARCGCGVRETNRLTLGIGMTRG
jgi:hypothetical protein